ncbi:hypothetical protein [Streptomyces sp. NPDC001889]
MLITGGDTAATGTALLIAAAPVGKGRLVDASSVLPALAAVPPSALTGTGAATVVELADPLDPQTVLTRIRAAAAEPGPLFLYVAGQLQLDRKQRLPHLALARSTPSTLRYTGLPWHWLASELTIRRPGTTTVFVDLVADTDAWRKVGEDGLGLGLSIRMYGRVVPAPSRREEAAPEYLRACASIWRAGARPGPDALHEQAVAQVGAEGALLLSGLPSWPGVFGEPGSAPAGTPGAPPFVSRAALPGTFPNPAPAASAPSPGAPGGTPDPDPAGPPEPLPGPAPSLGTATPGAPSAPSLPGAAAPSPHPAPSSEAPDTLPGPPLAAPAPTGTPVPAGAPEPSPGYGGAGPSPVVGGPPRRTRPGPGPLAPPGGGAADDPHPAILSAARAGRHTEAAAAAAAWEQQELRAHGPGSAQALHWLEVRADLARLAREPALSCELWMTAADARLVREQTTDDPDVEGAVDRAHHQWEQIQDAARARALAPRLVALRRRVPGRQRGALKVLQQRLESLHAEHPV